MRSESQNIYIGEGPGQKLAAVITVRFEPIFFEQAQVEQFVNDASIRLAEELAAKLNNIKEN